MRAFIFATFFLLAENCCAQPFVAQPSVSSLMALSFQNPTPEIFCSQWQRLEASDKEKVMRLVVQTTPNIAPHLKGVVAPILPLLQVALAQDDDFYSAVTRAVEQMVFESRFNQILVNIHFMVEMAREQQNFLQEPTIDNFLRWASFVSFFGFSQNFSNVTPKRWQFLFNTFLRDEKYHIFVPTLLAFFQHHGALENPSVVDFRERFKRIQAGEALVVDPNQK